MEKLEVAMRSQEELPFQRLPTAMGFGGICPNRIAEWRAG
jgi:hypothetical protein